jgi:hypothetical protein
MGAAGNAKRIAQDDDVFGDDLEMLQDILYDMLATGVDADQPVATTSAIERFLHEHAREPKSLAAFREFFEQHGLHPDACSHESAVLQLPPITTVREAAAVVDPPIELELSDLEESGFGRVAVAPPSAPRLGLPSRVAWALLAAVALALIGLGFRGYAMFRDLRAEVSAATQRHQQDRSALQRLSDQAADLESSVAATGELVQRMDQKSDLLLQSLLPESPVGAPASRTISGGTAPRISRPIPAQPPRD